MAFDSAALTVLLGRIPAKETIRGFVFNSVTHHVAERVSPQRASGLQERVLKRRPLDLLSYPATDYFRLLFGAVEVLTPQTQSDEVAMHDLGYASAGGFFASPMGKLLLGIVGTSDPARLMANAPTAYGTSFSFGQRTFARTGERELTLTHVGDFLPIPYNIGALKAALAAVKAEAQVRAHPEGNAGARYVLTW